MKAWRSLIIRIVQHGIKRGEVRSTVNPDVVATIIISTLEGAIMMSKLDRDSIHLERAVKHLQDYLNNL